MPAGGMAEHDGPGAAAFAHGVHGGADLAQDDAEADVGAEVIGGDGEADAVSQKRRGDPAEPALVQRLPVAAVQEDGDRGVRSRFEQVQHFARAGAIGDLARRPGGAGGLGGLAPALHHGGMVGHAGAVVVFRLRVEGRGARVEGGGGHRISLRINSPYPAARV